MNRRSILTSISILCLAAATTARADLTYTFDADAEGFSNVSWQPAAPVGWPGLPGSVMQMHTAGGWQMQMTKEFAWGPGGGDANQQLAMQAMANDPNARIRFNVMVDGTSFSQAETWYQLNVVGNSDGGANWTQIDKLIEGWQNAGQADLRTWSFDLSFGQLGWQPGDTWFQFWTGANSLTAVPVNFYLDNVVAYVPEPATLTLVGLGAAAWVLLRRRN